MPVRSPRAVYLIKGASSNNDDDPTKIDNLPGGTEPKTVRPIYCKMKVATGNYFGLVKLAPDDIAFQGTFKGEGLNKGLKYYKNIGGFREDSYKLIPVTGFTITEIIFDKDTNLYSTKDKSFKSLSIGFPKGVSVTEFLNWVATLTNQDKIRAVITPKGRRIAV